MSSLLIVTLMFIGGPAGEQPSGHIAARENFREVVFTASHYGERDGFDGKTMASGEKFNAADPTIAAHKRLPLGAKIVLTNPETGRTQAVVVKDRGPYAAGRDLDVSAAAAKKLGFGEMGVIRLRAKIIGAK